MDELVGKQLTKLVLIYDRGYMPPRAAGYHDGSLTLKTTEMPLYVFAYASDKLLAKYSSSPPYKSGKTWTLKVRGHKDLLFIILRKALTPSGNKLYIFHGVYYKYYLFLTMGIELANSIYRDITIQLQLNMKPNEPVENQVKIGENGESLFSSAFFRNSRIRWEGHYITYLRRRKAKRRLNSKCGVLIST